jgi:predicted nucleotidyltransferase
MASLDRRRLKNNIISSLKSTLGQTIEAVILFGSIARNEATDRSDIDILVVGEVARKGFSEANRIVYEALENVRTVNKRDTSVVVSTYEDLVKVNSFAINVASDGVIFYDATGRVTKLFAKIKQALSNGWVRYRTPDGCYGWMPNKPVNFGERITLLAED